MGKVMPWWVWAAIVAGGGYYFGRAQRQKKAIDEMRAGMPDLPTYHAAAAALPLMSPLYNMREVCKQIVLLEDHLNQTEKRCPDCITKHFITIEALIEEGLSLDKDGKYREKLDGEAEKIRSLQSGWAGGHPPAAIAQELRAIRKKWLPSCFDIQKVGLSVGSLADQAMGW